MTTMEVDCVLCICYNGLFMCDIQPIGLCRKFVFILVMYFMYSLDRKSDIFLSRPMRITRALHIIQYRFKNIQSFESITRKNVTLDDDTKSVDLNGYRIILNHSSLDKNSSFFVIFLCLLSIYLFK
jgi:hypothetical protein